MKIAPKDRNNLETDLSGFEIQNLIVRQPYHAELLLHMIPAVACTTTTFQLRKEATKLMRLCFYFGI